MPYTRREFGKLALAGVPAAAIFGRSDGVFGAIAAQAKPNGMAAGKPATTISSWIPITPGLHVEVMKAYSQKWNQSSFTARPSVIQTSRSMTRFDF